MTQTVKIAVTEHNRYQEEAPERWDWELVINHREKEIGNMYAAEIVTRRGAWLNDGKDGVDPLIPGLQEALRLLAKRAIWKVTQVVLAEPETEYGSPQEMTRDGDLPDIRGIGGDIPLPAERSGGVRPGGRQLQMSLAGSEPSRPKRQTLEPRRVDRPLGAKRRR